MQKCVLYVLRPHRKTINISTVLAGQRLGIKQVDDGIWVVSFSDGDTISDTSIWRSPRDLDNPFGVRLSPVS